MLRRVLAVLSVLAIFSAAEAMAQSPNSQANVSTELRLKVQDTWIVTLDPGASNAEVSAVANQAASAGQGQVQHIYRSALKGFAITLPAGAAAALSSLPNVIRVEKDAVAYAFEPPPAECRGPNKDPSCGNTEEDPVVQEPVTSSCLPPSVGADEFLWGIDMIGASGSSGGAGVHVYVIDSGIDRDHLDLCENLDATNSVAFGTSCRGGACLADWDDDNGHGTHVAGTIGAIKGNTGVAGVAPSVTLHAVKVLDKRGSGSYSAVIAGVDYVAAQTGCVVVDGVPQPCATPVVANMSLGGSNSTSLKDAIATATSMGVLFAVAAGNSGRDAKDYSPANSDRVLTVSAKDSKCAWPSWSNWGNTVDLAAPGVGIKSTWTGGGYNTISGTSMASPHVAGALALWLETYSPETDVDGDQIFADASSALMLAAEGTSVCVNDEKDSRHLEDFLQVQ